MVILEKKLRKFLLTCYTKCSPRNLININNRMKTFNQFLQEGVNDPSIFKAVFLAGGPGSGKSFVVGKTALTALGFKVVNSDDAFENAMKKAGMEMDPENIFSVKGQELRGQAKA